MGARLPMGGFQRTHNMRGSVAAVITDSQRHRVQFEGKDIAWFDLTEEKNAMDFCNGFNAGYMKGRDA